MSNLPRPDFKLGKSTFPANDDASTPLVSSDQFLLHRQKNLLQLLHLYINLMFKKVSTYFCNIFDLLIEPFYS